MSTWDYRIMKYDTGEYGIHEVYYADNGKIMSWTERGSTFCLDTNDAREFHLVVFMMKLAFNRPVLDYDTGGEL